MSLTIRLRQDNLQAFWSTHLSPEAAEAFAATFRPLASVRSSADGEATVLEDDDGLGYYPDGVKRTLTDEQIAMFRHSEIHQLQRARRLEQELIENGEKPPTDSPTSTAQAFSSARGDVSSARGDASASVEATERGTIYDEDAKDEDEEREYEAFLAREREDLAGGNGRLLEEDPLPYDEEGEIQEATTSVETAAVEGGTGSFQPPDAGIAGRKRLWYGDVDESVPEDPFAKKEGKDRKFLWPAITPISDGRP